MQIEQIKGERSLTLKLQGAIDENADYSEISFDGIEKVIFDFEKLVRLNSTGIQKWIKFFQSIPTDMNIVLQNCSIPVVNQLNIFPNFISAENLTIESFYGPYYCEECDDTYSILLNNPSDFPDQDNYSAPAKLCPKDNSDLEFDEIEKKYFLFLKR